MPLSMARETLASLLARPEVRIIVAKVGGELAATCQLGVIPTLSNGGRPFGIIEHVVTASAFRRQGLSQKVLEQALSLAWGLDGYKVMLLSGEGRDEALQGGHREGVCHQAGRGPGLHLDEVRPQGLASALLP